ncbi:MAG: DUF3078 domain-containing protein [Chloroherpetonaceae bacterium]|nr:DUF3078 domain-containing protein [Chloroherpetonaceae bacterium]
MKNKRFTICIFTFIVLSISLQSIRICAQEMPADTSWKTSGDFGVNLSQISLTNWAGGGQNSTTVIGLFNYNFVYEKDNVKWNNVIQLGYGETKVEGQSWRKTDDRLIFLSQLHHKSAIQQVSYSGSVDFRTQFTVGKDYSNSSEPVISNFMAPAYLLTNLGFEYAPSDFFTVTFAPLGARTIFVLDKNLSDVGAFGVTPGSSILFEGGMNLNALFKKDVFENVLFQSRLNVFGAYTHLQTLVVMWESLLVMKVNKFINVTAALDVFYDEKVVVQRSDGTVGPSTQLRNLFALGILYKF